MSVVILSGTIVYAAFHGVPRHGDTAVLVQSSHVMARCIRHGRLWDCGGHAVTPSATTSIRAVAPYPLLQFIPAIALAFFGASSPLIARGLLGLSAVSVAVMIVASYWVLRRLVAPLWAPLIVASLLASPLLFYAASPFGEEFAAAVILVAVIAVLVDAKPLVIVALVCWAGVTKETNPVFVAVLTATCSIAISRQNDRMSPRRQLYAIAIGTTFALFFNASFNVFRYGTPRNLDYMRSALHTTNPSVVARVFAALWLSPNGGLVWFWPLAPVLVLVLAWRSLRDRADDWRRVAPLVVALLFVAQLLLLSTWWAPFGWSAWGPRLALPLIPAMVLASAVLAAPYCTNDLARFLTSRLFVPVASVIVLIGLPQATVPFYGLTVTRFFKAPAPFCRGGGIFSDPSRYYDCLLKTAWTKHPPMLRLGLHGLDRPLGATAAIAYIVAMTALLYRARRDATRYLRPVQQAELERPRAQERAG